MVNTRGAVIVLDPLAVTALVLASVLVTKGRLDAQRPAPGTREEHPVAAPRWGVSSLGWRSHAVATLDYHAHLLLPEGDHSKGVLKARCGDVMITGLTQHDQPPPGLRCARCHLIFLADVSVR